MMDERTKLGNAVAAVLESSNSLRITRKDGMYHVETDTMFADATQKLVDDMQETYGVDVLAELLKAVASTHLRKSAQ